MKLFRKATEAMKDRRSIYLAKIGRKKGFRNPDLEAAVIKATSHDESLVDYKNANRVFDWVRTSPTFLEPLIWALTNRLEKTHNWVVTLKALLLIHGVFCTKIPAVRKIGRLPFDLSTFHDRSSNPTKSWGFSAFIHAYFAFLDLHSTFLSYYREEEKGEKEKEEEEERERELMMRKSLLRLHRSQALLDLLLQIKPYTNGMEVGLVMEAMNCIVIEIFDIYSGICRGIAAVLAEISSATTSEAAEALEILQKIALQSSKLSGYLQVCKETGGINATDLPPIEHIPEEDIRDLERIILGISSNGDMGENDQETKKQQKGEGDDNHSGEATVMENWEVFCDELQMECH